MRNTLLPIMTDSDEVCFRGFEGIVGKTQFKSSSKLKGTSLS